MRNSAIDSTATHCRSMKMLMRSMTPAHGVGWPVAMPPTTGTVSRPKASSRAIVMIEYQRKRLPRAAAPKAMYTNIRNTVMPAQTRCSVSVSVPTPGGNDFALVHGWPISVEQAVDHEQAADNIQPSISISCQPDAHAKGDHQDLVRHANRNPPAPGWSADGRQLTHLLGKGVIARVQQRACDIHAHVEQRGGDATAKQNFSRRYAHFRSAFVYQRSLTCVAEQVAHRKRLLPNSIVASCLSAVGVTG